MHILPTIQIYASHVWTKWSDHGLHCQMPSRPWTTDCRNKDGRFVRCVYNAQMVHIYSAQWWTYIEYYYYYYMRTKSKPYEVGFSEFIQVVMIYLILFIFIVFHQLNAYFGAVTLCHSTFSNAQAPVVRLTHAHVDVEVKPFKTHVSDTLFSQLVTRCPHYIDNDR